MRARSTRASDGLVFAILCAVIGIPGTVSAQTGCCNIGAATCQIVTSSECTMAGGMFFPGGACGVLDPNRCVPMNDPKTCCNVTVAGAPTCSNPASATDCFNAGGMQFPLGSCGVLDPDRCVPMNDPKTCCNVTSAGEPRVCKPRC